MAQSKRTAASYVAEERNKKKPKKNPDLYKRRYKTLKEHRAAVAARKALQDGKNVGPVANVEAYGEQIKPKKKPAKKPPVTSQSKPVKPVKPSAQANKGSGRDGTFGTGTYGKGRPSDNKKEQPKPKAKTPVRRRRGSGVRRTGKQGVNVGQALRNFVTSVDKNLKLTHKKGDVKKVGRSTFRWDGKRWVKLNRPF